MINAMVREMNLQSDYLEGQKLSTIYFGGGTPSAMPPEDIHVLLSTASENFQLLPEIEVTLEANPDDITNESVELWKKSGINRLSIGIQAFQDELLSNWNRSHSAKQAEQAIALAQQAGITNITADLIYGGPGLSDNDWQSNIDRLIDSGIPHISSYALTVETGTALFHQIKKSTTAAPDDEQDNRQYAILQEKLADVGFIQYEVSNFAKPGFESKHNTSYWSGQHYLGIGPSAHSYNGHSRQWNVAHNVNYINSLREGNIPFEKEELTEHQRFNELIMTGLRTTIGIDQTRLASLGKHYVDYLEEHIQPFSAKGQVIKNVSGNWMLKPSFFFFADGIAADLFYEEGNVIKT